MTERQEPLGPDGLTADERCLRLEAEPLPTSINALFDDATAEAPHATIWEFVEDGTRHSYAEARAIVLQTAAALSSWGVRKGDPVAVMMPNVVHYPVLWFALARIGAVIVPINIRYSARELTFVLHQSRARRLVIHTDCAPLLTPEILELLPAGGIVVCPDGATGSSTESAAMTGLFPMDALLRLGVGRTPPDVAVTPDDLMSIQFTSGTTGFPKGCSLTHRYWLISGKVNAMRDGRIYRRVWASTPFTYMDPHWLLLMALYRRGTLFVARHQSASRFMGWMRDHRIEFCILPMLVLKQPPTDRDAHNALIRANVYGLTPHNRRAMEARFGITAREAYGMTEIGSALFVPIEAADKADAGSCGRPAPFRRLRIVDSHGNEVPAGTTGELQVAGPGIMRGYFGDRAATEDAFDGEWFRTGDLFRCDSDGYYYFVGRIKDVIRRSGENISAREVEAVIRELNSVVEVAAIPVQHESRGEEVKIFVVRAEACADRDTVVSEILEHCGRNLAVFKQPRYICFLKTLPLTSSGKVAKQQLRETSRVADLPVYDRETGRWITGDAAAGELSRITAGKAAR